ncbi:MAG: hypothetical protein H6742_04190 [Alphaproteobacteria bacterium]|nr:hypothetical protein [Alphaproteobacteria bacterium]
MSPLLIAALSLSSPAHAAPALVTAAEGDVKVDGKPAPPAPFLVQDGSSLVLGPGGAVVVLAGGNAKRIATAGAVDLAALHAAPSAQAPALAGLLSHQVDASQAGATRAGGPVVLTRPVAGSLVLSVDALAWRCPDGCDGLAVELAPFPAGDQVLSCTETPCAVPADALAPGTWAVQAHGRPVAAFKVAEPDQAAELQALVQAGDAAAEALPPDDPAGRASVQAAVRWRAGLPSDALQLLDRAVAAHPDDGALSRLRDAYEARAGLAP